VTKEGCTVPIWRRRLRIAAAVGFLAVTSIPLAALPTEAGGGCHGEATEGTGAVVVMAERCFGPTVLRVAPGTQVTWVSKDSDVHTVTGFGYQWGSQGDLGQGERFSTMFRSRGVFPYTCYLHPGMNGAVVVGDAAPSQDGGLAPQSGAVAVHDAAAPRAATRVVTAGQTTAGSAGPWPALTGVGFALAFAGGVTLIWLRRRIASARSYPS
jgi:plastocyanin